jgi:hypothetical protein
MENYEVALDERRRRCKMRTDFLRSALVVNYAINSFEKNDTSDTSDLETVEAIKSTPPTMRNQLYSNLVVTKDIKLFLEELFDKASDEFSKLPKRVKEASENTRMRKIRDNAHAQKLDNLLLAMRLLYDIHEHMDNMLRSPDKRVVRVGEKYKHFDLKGTARQRKVSIKNRYAFYQSLTNGAPMSKHQTKYPSIALQKIRFILTFINDGYYLSEDEVDKELTHCWAALLYKFKDYI